MFNYVHFTHFGRPVKVRLAGGLARRVVPCSNAAGKPAG